MEYTVEIINPLNQDNFYYCVFILSDISGIMPTIRLNKRFEDGVNLDYNIEQAKQADCAYFKEQYINNQENLES